MNTEGISYVADFVSDPDTAFADVVAHWPSHRNKKLDYDAREQMAAASDVCERAHVDDPCKP